jgi:hypothetical protein
MQSPTYLEFRTWALAQGYTSEILAEHIDTINPPKTAEGILLGLSGTHWDSEPLYHPSLCALYHGASVPQQPEPPAPYPHVTVANLSHVAPAHRPWMVMWEAGWSTQKITDTWSTVEKPLTAEHVQAVLDEASLEHLSPIPSYQLTVRSFF